MVEEDEPACVVPDDEESVGEGKLSPVKRDSIGDTPTRIQRRYGRSSQERRCMRYTILNSAERAGVAGGAPGRCKVGDAHAEVVDPLAVLEADGFKLRLEPSHARVAHTVGALVLHADGFPCNLRAPLAGEHAVNLRRGGAQQRRQGLLVLAPWYVVILDRVPQRRGLEVDLHHRRPVDVLTPLQHREGQAGAAAASGLAHHILLDDDLVASLTYPAPSPAWRSSSPIHRRRGT